MSTRERTPDQQLQEQHCPECWREGYAVDGTRLGSMTQPGQRPATKFRPAEAPREIERLYACPRCGGRWEVDLRRWQRRK